MKAQEQPAPPARDRLLTAAGDLFYAHGINATGVDAIVQRAGVSLATCYKHFGGKDNLVAAYLDERDGRWRTGWEATIAAAGDPRRRTLAIFDALAQWWATEDSRRGCAHVDAAVELADPEHPARAVVARHKGHIRQRLAELAAETGVADPGQVAADILLLYEGSVTALLLDLTPDPIGRARRLAGHLLPDEPRSLRGG